MKILIKIEEFKKDKNTIIGRFCNWKSQKPIDSYRKRMISCEGLDDSNIVNFVESLGEQASMKIYSDEKRLPSPPENNPLVLFPNPVKLYLLSVISPKSCAFPSDEIVTKSITFPADG